MNVVGGVKEIQQAADVMLPYGTAPITGLATEDTPCCAGMGPWIKHESARFVWDEEEGARSFKKDADGEYTVTYVTFDLVNQVPHFPRHRGFAAFQHTRGRGPRGGLGTRADVLFFLCCCRSSADMWPALRQRCAKPP